MICDVDEQKLVHNLVYHSVRIDKEYKDILN